MARDRYGYRRNRRGPGRLVVLVLILAAGAGGAWWYVYYRNDAPPANNGNSETRPAANGNGGQAGRPGGNGNAASKPPEPSLAERASAVKYCDEGMRLLKANKPFEARTALSHAVLSGHLPAKRDAQAVGALTKLADEYVLSPRIDERDVYAKEYVLTDDDGKGPAMLERKLKLHVPWQAMIIVSDPDLARRVREGKDGNMDVLEAKATKLQVGQRIKTIPGPCHAIIYKSRHIMDLYLHRSACDKVFLRRIRVGLGKYKSTPTGKWKVVNKQVKGDYFPAANSPLRSRGRIPYGKKDYAFGKKGLWLGLEGTDETTKGRTGYGIHSTSKQASIGTDASEGCIRVSDNAIDLVFCMLYEQWATVEIRP